MTYHEQVIMAGLQSRHAGKQGLAAACTGPKRVACGRSSGKPNFATPVAGNSETTVSVYVVRVGNTGYIVQFPVVVVSQVPGRNEKAKRAGLKACEFVPVRIYILQFDTCTMGGRQHGAITKW